MSENFWRSISAKEVKESGPNKEDGVELQFERTDRKVIIVLVTKSQIGDAGLVRAIEIAEKHKECDCEVGKYKEHRERKRRATTS